MDESRRNTGVWNDSEDSQTLQAAERAVEEYGFCPNRVWAAASSHPDKERILVTLFPAKDDRLQQMFGRGGDETGRKGGHSGCTFDFCEQTQVNYTSVSQRHESPSCRVGPCSRIQGLFSRDELNEAGRGGKLMAWQLYGRKIVQPGQHFMAISHVWSDGTGAGVWPAGEVNKCLYHFFRTVARRFYCEGLWWDTLCIPSDKVARANAINNMHMNYRNAAFTFVHDCFLRDVEFTDAETACIAIIMSPWFSRGWTALELANSKVVKIAFKRKASHNDRMNPVILDLDEDLLRNPQTERHRIVARAINNLRHNTITDVNQLLSVLGPRYTSWAKDMTIILGLLVGVQVNPIQHADAVEHTDDVNEEYIRQAVLRKIDHIGHGHLFHNLPTIANGSSWCPARLLSLPLSTSVNSLRLDADGNVIGVWKVLPVECFSHGLYTWRDAHPLVAARLRTRLKQEEYHRCLVEPLTAVSRFLLVEIIEETPDSNVYQLVGCLHLHQPQELDAQFPEKLVTITNLKSKGGDNRKGSDCSGDNDQLLSSDWVANNDQDPQSSLHRSPSAAAIEWQGTALDDHTFLRQDTDDIPLASSSLLERPGSYLKPDSANHMYVYIPEEPKRCAREDSDLLASAKVGDEATVRKLLVKGADIGCCDEDGRTSVSWAAGKGHKSVLQILLNWYTYFWYPEVEGLERQKINIEPSMVDRASDKFRVLCNRMDKDGRTPLSWAAGEGKLETIRLLLQYHETSLDATDPAGWTPLWYAAATNRLGSMKMLLRAGARIDIEDRDSCTLILRMARRCPPTAVKLLLDKGADDRDVEASVSEAVRGGNTLVLKLLLDAGVDPDVRLGHLDFTPLMYAIFNKQEEMVRLLLERGKVDVNFQRFDSDLLGKRKDSLPSNTPLFAAVFGNQAWDYTVRHTEDGEVLPRPEGFASIVKLLLATGRVDVNLRHERDETVLHIAAGHGDEATAQMLLDTEGIDINVRDAAGRTPLYWAAEAGRATMVEQLLRTGKVDIGIKTEMRTVADPSIVQQWTAHDVAKSRKHGDIVRILRDYGKQTGQTRSRGLLRYFS